MDITNAVVDSTLTKVEIWTIGSIMIFGVFPLVIWTILRRRNGG